MKYEDFNWDGFVFGEAYRKSIFDFCAAHSFTNGLEVGFDAGSSASVFLRACPNATLLSVEIVKRPIGEKCVQDCGVTDRHTLVYADSIQYLKQLAEEKKTFDYIYIDGDHFYEGAKADLVNALPLLAPGGYILADDADPTHTMFGVYQAVQEFCAEFGLTSTPLPGSSSFAAIISRA